MDTKELMNDNIIGEYRKKLNAVLSNMINCNDKDLLNEKCREFLAFSECNILDYMNLGLDDMIELLESKKNSYGKENITSLRSIGLLCRILDKVSRINNGSHNIYTLKEAFIDIHGYVFLLHFILTKHEYWIDIDGANKFFDAITVDDFSDIIFNVEKNKSKSNILKI